MTIGLFLAKQGISAAILFVILMGGLYTNTGLKESPVNIKLISPKDLRNVAKLYIMLNVGL